ncbi:unnamed protein product [Prorocentrum cordatum]|uniref:Replication protein A subunit n=1 Tax=Prorocentrum cordatum TaxID=2364126 RepID=A0ABN9VHS1_9DINO|nr:unnamed protein product [Polarella glacialis]
MAVPPQMVRRQRPRVEPGVGAPTRVSEQVPETTGPVSPTHMVSDLTATSVPDMVLRLLKFYTPWKSAKGTKGIRKVKCIDADGKEIALKSFGSKAVSVFSWGQEGDNILVNGLEASKWGDEIDLIVRADSNIKRARPEHMNGCREPAQDTFVVDALGDGAADGELVNVFGKIVSCTPVGATDQEKPRRLMSIVLEDDAGRGRIRLWDEVADSATKLVKVGNHFLVRGVRGKNGVYHGFPGTAIACAAPPGWALDSAAAIPGAEGGSGGQSSRSGGPHEPVPAPQQPAGPELPPSEVRAVAAIREQIAIVQGRIPHTPVAELPTLIGTLTALYQDLENAGSTPAIPGAPAAGAAAGLPAGTPPSGPAAVAADNARAEGRAPEPRGDEDAGGDRSAAVGGPPVDSAPSAAPAEEPASPADASEDPGGVGGRVSGGGVEDAVRAEDE